MSTAAPTAPHPKLVPTTTAAAHTGLPDETIRRLVRKEGLPCVRIGPKFYFDLDKVDAWIDDWFDRAAADSAAGAVAESAVAETAASPQARPDPYRDQIKRLVDDAPPLTAEQAAKIRAILGGAA